MASTDASPPPARAFGPVELRDAPLVRRLLGVLLAFVGVQILAWAVGTGAVVPAVVHTAIGTFAVLNGLYLGGVRPR